MARRPTAHPPLVILPTPASLLKSDARLTPPPLLHSAGRPTLHPPFVVWLIPANSLKSVARPTPLPCLHSAAE
ncbi:hypothetical protein F2P81_004991 [Scophthalmus maximus]|uniref:Uncharacterized protein n=1 Tax=Scophthalmus maximus TaxID=52904 RepID=A0A6A4TKA2_SCOMX|nr:hypothetical protein F2P81_004991 [Scophthalmus maximus]